MGCISWCHGSWVNQWDDPDESGIHGAVSPQLKNGMLDRKK